MRSFACRRSVTVDDAVLCKQIKLCEGDGEWYIDRLARPSVILADDYL